VTQVGGIRAVIDLPVLELQTQKLVGELPANYSSAFLHKEVTSMFERNNWIWLLLTLLLLALVLATPVGGRKGNVQSTAPGESTFSGTIDAVNHHKCEICNQDELSITLKSDSWPIEVRLGPTAFFEERDFYVSRGDTVKIVGLRFTERGNDVVLANEVRKAGESLLLRGKFGKPAWIEKNGHTCPVCGN